MLGTLAVKHPGFVVVCLSIIIAACVPADESIDSTETEEGDDDPGASDPIDDLAVTSSAVTLAAGCVAQASLGGHPTWFFFTRPDRPCKGTTRNLDPNAVDELIRLIRSVPAGGRIDGHIFSINIKEVALALVDAQNIKHVNVWLSTNGAFQTNQNPLKKYFDGLAHHVYCHHGNNEACIATADMAISHTKLFTFSTAVAPDGRVANNVVWFGSANQTTDSGEELYNNTVTVYGDATLYSKLRSYLGDLFAQRRRADYYDAASGRGHVIAAAAHVFVSPEVQTDLVASRLDDFAPDASCEVRVMQHAIHDSRLNIVNQLALMARAHCRVSVVAQTVEPRALAAFHAVGIPVRQGKIHDKSFIVSARFAGRLEKRVYTGSHNMGSGSAHRFDEIFVQLAPETGAAHPVYDAYVAHFADAYNIGKPL